MKSSAREAKTFNAPRKLKLAYYFMPSQPRADSCPPPSCTSSEARNRRVITSAPVFLLTFSLAWDVFNRNHRRVLMFPLTRLRCLTLLTSHRSLPGILYCTLYLHTHTHEFAILARLCVEEATSTRTYGNEHRSHLTYWTDLCLCKHTVNTLSQSHDSDRRTHKSPESRFRVSL